MQVDTKKNTHVKEMSTWHKNGPFPVDQVYTAKQRKGELKQFDLHNESVLQVQKAIENCDNDGQRFRAFGSLWSLNDIAFNQGRLHNNYDLDMRLEISPESIHKDSLITADNLVFSQCGATVNQLTGWLEKRGKSLRTCGGSNGQTIAGVTSTGVHGGAMGRQAISDYIKGLHLVIGPKPEDRVYLERASEKVLDDSFAQTLNSRLIRDDDIFNAAIVGLGSFGFIAAIVMEVEDIYSLKRYIRKIKYKDAVQLLKTLDFENSNFKIEEEVDKHGKTITPYHFKPYINQYTKKCVAEVLYKIPYQKTKRPIFEIEKQLHPDIFNLMHWALEKSGGKVTKLLTKLLQGEAFPNPKKENAPVIGTLGDIFHAVGFQQPGFSWAIGVDHRSVDKALDVFIEIFKEMKVPGLTAIKLVQQTDSTIGFTKFPITAVIGMDGVQWNAKGGMPTKEMVERKIVKAFLDNNIDFTFHWGKNAAWDYPRLSNHMYGSQCDVWMEQRSRLLSYEMADMFSNDFLRRVGLASYRNDIDVIA